MSETEKKCETAAKIGTYVGEMTATEAEKVLIFAFGMATAKQMKTTEKEATA